MPKKKELKRYPGTVETIVVNDWYITGFRGEKRCFLRHLNGGDWLLFADNMDEVAEHMKLAHMVPKAPYRTDEARFAGMWLADPFGVSLKESEND